MQLLEYGGMLLGGTLAKYWMQYPADIKKGQNTKLNRRIQSGSFGGHNSPLWDIRVIVKTTVRLLKHPFRLSGDLPRG